MALRRDIRVLVVDDMAVSRQILGQMLDHLGVGQVTTCANADAGLQVLRTQAVDLVISDLNMPAMDGVGFLKRLRQLPGHTATPFVLTSGIDSSGRLDEARQMGMRSLLIKPFKVDLLLHCLENAVGRI